VYGDQSESLDVLGSTVLVEEVLDGLDVGCLSLLFALALLVVPGGPLGLGLKLNSPWFLVVVVANGGLLVETVEGKFLIIGDFLESGFFS